MVFKPRQKRSICNIQISIDNQNIVKVKETNFVGVILDENLNIIPIDFTTLFATFDISNLQLLEVGNIKRCK